MTSSNEFQPITVESIGGSKSLIRVSATGKRVRIEDPGEIVRLYDLPVALDFANAIRAAVAYVDPALAPPSNDGIGISDLQRRWEDNMERRMSSAESTIATMLAVDDLIAQESEPQLSRVDIERRLAAVEAFREKSSLRSALLEDSGRKMLAILEAHETRLDDIQSPKYEEPAASGEPEREAVLPEGYSIYHYPGDTREAVARGYAMRVSAPAHVTVRELAEGTLAVCEAQDLPEARRLLAAHLAQRAGAEAARCQ